MKYKFTTMPLLAAFLFTLVACGNLQNQEAVDQIITNTEEHFAPDGRTAIFDIETKSQNGNLVLAGETSLPAAKAALLDSLTKIQVEAVDSIRVLPSDELKGQVLGIVNNSVANIRSEPSHPAQLVTQATMGMPLRVLKKRSNWYLVQMPDDYLGWVDSGGLELMTEGEFNQWQASSKVIYGDTYGAAYKQSSASSQKVSDLVAGSILSLSGIEGNYYKVQYPDGRTGYISKSEATPFDEWKSTVEVSEENLVKTAKTMIGSPYLWGGTSTKGMDCSGYTKTVYFMNGWVIPRDASQQIRAGKAIDTSNGFDNLRRGDLLFFGTSATDSTSQQVVHVGMWIGDGEFIHSSGKVRISSVDPEAKNYDEPNVNRFLEAKRYLNHKQGNIIDVAKMYSLNDYKEVAS